MIIWNGLIAKAFSFYKEDQNVLIFASGVSNSQNIDSSLFLREQTLIEKSLQDNTEKLFVYFSTCSIYDDSITQSDYIQHKLKIEQIIQDYWNEFLIIRISNPIWKTDNPNTLLNYLKNNIVEDIEFDLFKNAKRNLIDVDDLFRITKYIISHSLFIREFINIANPYNFSIHKIVSCLEVVLEKKALFKEIDSWGEPRINLSKIEKVLWNINIDFGSNYIEKLLMKYYWKLK